MSDVSLWRRVISRQWVDPAFQSLSTDEQLVKLYFETGPQTTSLGVIGRVSLGMAAEELPRIGENVKACLEIVCRAFGWQFDPAVRVLLRPNWLDETMTTREFCQWWGSTRLLGRDGNILIVSVPTREHEGWIRRHYSGQLDNALRETGIEAVVFRVSSEAFVAVAS